MNKNSLPNAQEHFQNMSSMRIQRRNLVYVIGLPKNLAKQKILSNYEFFGQYGIIERIFIDKKHPYNSGHTPVPSYGAFITFQDSFQAGLAVLALDHYLYHDFKIKASFGLTRFCKFFLLGQQCHWKNCQFLHHFGPNDEVLIPGNVTLTKKKQVLEFLTQHPFIFTFLEQKFNKSIETEFPSLKTLKKNQNCFQKNKENNRSFMNSVVSNFTGMKNLPTTSFLLA